MPLTTVAPEVGGTGITVPGSNGNVLTSNGTAWVSQAPAGGGVTSAVAGNGISVSGATGAVTFSAACPAFNTVGSYSWAYVSAAAVAGSNYATPSPACWRTDTNGYSFSGTLSGTWKWMGDSVNVSEKISLVCRVS